MNPSRPIALRAPARSAESVREELARRAPALVALSGGVDSAVVAFLAREALGPGALAATLVGPSVSRDEVAQARAVADAVGIAHALVPADPLADEAYRVNDADRCYHCRRVETAALRAWGEPRGVRRYLDGVHADDLSDDRPGLRAMDAAGFEHPLLRAGWGKREVREFARERGLPNWDRPSNACLASRVVRGQALSAELLARVERAEELVRARGFRRVRVRAEGADARVEVDPVETPRLLARDTAETLRRELAALGFAAVTLDAAGYRARPNA